MGLRFHRYLGASEFARELEPLRAYRGDYVGDGLLESLEAARLLIPRIRIRYPDPVARRFWLERHERQLKHEVEPDGVRWESAVQLSNAMYRWGNHIVYGASPHPLDDPDPRFYEFIQCPAATAFQPWQEMRVDVSNDVEATLFDSHSVESYYSSWQLLLAAEVADAGIHFRINLADEDISRSAHGALRDGKTPADGYSVNLLPVHATRDFVKHETTLNAVVWYAEECGRALMEILKEQGGGRFRLSQTQHECYLQANLDAAQMSARRHQINIDELVELCRLLSARWSDWNRNGRPLIADTYKEFLAETVQMAKQFGELSFLEVRDRVGNVGGWHKPVLDAVWPNWAEQEKDRVRLTLKASITSEKDGVLDAANVDAFVDFLAGEGLEAFFWRLRSFEDHAFRGNEFAIEGMKSDLQGIAVAVEHVAIALGGTETQLYEKFKQLWRSPDVLGILKRDDVSRLARQERLAHNWSVLKAKIDALRSEEGGKIAADLVMAHRIRAGVHHALPEDDQFELEALFVTLMRAAALTFAEAQRTKKGRQGAVKAPSKPSTHAMSGAD
jgi:hypothetical protein